MNRSVEERNRRHADSLELRVLFQKARRKSSSLGSIEEQVWGHAGYP